MEQENEQTQKTEQIVDVPVVNEAASQNTSSARKLYRDTEHAWVAGVCAGLAKHFNTDVLLVRLLTVAFAFVTGGGIIPLIYVIMAFVVPAEALAPGKVSTERMWIMWLLVVLLLLPFVMAILAMLFLIPMSIMQAVF